MPGPSKGLLPLNMATSSQSSSSTSSPPPPNACYDSLDMDAFINYDPIVYPSPSISPVSSRSKSTVNTSFAMANSNNILLLPSQSSTQQAFSGPSHQYDLHKQQTGLPMGGLATTIAVNDASNISFDALSASENFYGLDPTDDLIDFGVAPTKNLALGPGSDMDMEFESSSPDGLPPFFYPQDSQPSSATFVDPNAIGGQEEMPVTPLASHGNVGRLWPGAHQQQAAKAKAHADAHHRKNERLSQQHQQHQPQRPQQPQENISRPNRPANHPPADPIVEERISRLLSQMRQGSVASSEGDASHGGNGVLPQIARMRKEEEDMDEDERLLASEEGKKLSSKERRQLRNKVSARAFRSRRKGNSDAA